MASTSMTLGPHWEQFLKDQVASGAYSSASEVVREALRDLEEKRRKIENLRQYIQEGEDSGFVDWNPDEFQRRVSEKYGHVAESDQTGFEHED